MKIEIYIPEEDNQTVIAAFKQYGRYSEMIPNPEPKPTAQVEDGIVLNQEEIDLYPPMIKNPVSIEMHVGHWAAEQIVGVLKAYTRLIEKGGDKNESN